MNLPETPPIPPNPPTLQNDCHNSHTVTSSLNGHMPTHRQLTQTASLIVPKPNDFESNPHAKADGYSIVGVLISNGTNYGKEVWQGPKGGFFFYDSNYIRHCLPHD